MGVQYEMKSYNYAIVFLLVFISLFSIQNARISTFVNAQYESVALNDAVDSAIDSAVTGLVSMADGYSVEIQRETASTQFYRALHASMGILNDEDAQEMLDVFIPILAFADTDGICVQYMEETQNGYVKVWGPKYSYSKEYIYHENNGLANSDWKYTIAYTMEDVITVTIDNTVYTDTWTLLKDPGDTATQNYGSDAKLVAVMGQPQFDDAESFDAYRKEAITSIIVEKLEYYTSLHNRIGAVYGQNYTFSFPESADSEIIRAIEYPTFMCLFQGYPLAGGTSQRYNNFALGAARVAKGTKYFTQAIDGYLYYHKGTCTAGSGDICQYQTREECAWHGAMPCEVCNP